MLDLYFNLNTTNQKIIFIFLFLKMSRSQDLKQKDFDK